MNDQKDGIPVAEAPQWVLDKLASKKDCQQQLPTSSQAGTLPPVIVRKIRSALNMIDCEDRDQWIECGMAIHAESSGSMQGYGLWEEWSQRSEKYDARDQKKTWDSFRSHGINIETLFFRARQNGWVPPPPDNVVDISKIIEEGTTGGDNKATLADSRGHEIIVQEAFIPNRPKVVDLPLPDNDFFQIAHQYVMGASTLPQHNLAFSSVCSAIATAAGGRIQSETGLYTTLYTLNVASTGAGKEAPAQCAKAMLEASELGGLIGGDRIGSGQALLSNLAERPTSFYAMDEIGLKLQMAAKDKGGHRAEVFYSIIEIYSKAGTLYRGTEYADLRINQKTIHSPCVILYGSSTKETLVRALTSGDAVSGLLNRFILFEGYSPLEIEENDPPADRHDVPSEITELLKAVHTPQHSGGDLVGTGVGKPVTVMRDKSAKLLFKEYRREALVEMERRRKIGDPSSALYARAREHAEKLALICAISRDPINRRVTEADAEWAVQVVRLSQDRMLAMADEHIADSEFESRCKAVLKVVRKIEHRKKGNNATYAAILKSSALKAYTPREIREAMEKIVSMGSVNHYREYQPGPKGGKAINVYVTEEKLVADTARGGGIGS